MANTTAPVSPAVPQVPEEEKEIPLTPLEIKESTEKVSATLVYMLRDPSLVFYSTVIMQMKIVHSSKCPTMGVGFFNNQLILLINAGFVKKLKFKELVAVLIHEVWHVIMSHMNRETGREHEKWNIAADIAINQFIDNLPDGCLLPDAFNLPPELAAETYYDKIPTKKISIVCGPNGKGGKKGLVDDHGQWQPMTANEKEIVKQVVQEAAKQKGNVPGELQSAVEAWLKPPKIPWQNVLRHFIHGSIKASMKASWKRPNRRFGSGIKGRSPSRLAKIIITVDTSGSVSDTMLKRFMSEMGGIQKHYPTDITVIECDMDIQRVVKLVKGRPYDGKFKGRGGTSFKPPFKYIHDKGLRPDLMIYLTDGEGDFPDTAPPYATLWAVENNGFTQERVPFGRVLMIDENEGE